MLHGKISLGTLPLLPASELLVWLPLEMEFINSYLVPMCWPTERIWKWRHHLNLNLYFSVLLPWRFLWPENIFTSEEYLYNIWHLAECRGKSTKQRWQLCINILCWGSMCMLLKKTLCTPLILTKALNYFWIFFCTSHVLQKKPLQLIK